MNTPVNKTQGKLSLEQSTQQLFMSQKSQIRFMKVSISVIVPLTDTADWLIWNQIKVTVSDVIEII